MSKHECPVCKKHEFQNYDSFEYCPVCGWMDDAYQEANPDEGSLSNSVCLNTARKNYEETGRCNKDEPKGINILEDKELMNMLREMHEQGIETIADEIMGW